MQSLPFDRQKKLSPPMDAASPAQRALAAAFASFAQTAGSLETTYTRLQAELGRLRRELEHKNRSLAQSLEENQRMRAYLASIVEGLPCGVLVFDRQMKPRLINPAAGRLLTGATDGAVSSDSRVPRLLGALLAALPREERSQEQEWEVAGPGPARTLGVTRASIPANSAERDFLVILRDLTESKLLEREREATRRSQALAEVAALLAHEIRNPLGSLELFAGLLAEALADRADVQPWINHVQAGLRSLATTVNNVLHFHSPSAQLVPLDLVRFLGETVEFLRPVARQKEMQIEWRAAEDAVSVLADPPRLQQAFLNLTLNAFRAMRPGGRLAIGMCRRAENSRPLVCISLADQGSGISPENLEKIFEPGFTTQPGSPGLGLAVTRKVVEQHGGSIRVESREGVGTTFTLALPLAGQANDRAIP
jgi:two-component system sensor histidine kinase FlrB